MAAAVTLVTSCGDASGDEAEVTACSCVKDGEALAKEVIAAGDDADKMAALAKKGEALEQKCKDFSDEDMKACK